MLRRRCNARCGRVRVIVVRVWCTVVPNNQLGWHKPPAPTSSTPYPSSQSTTTTTATNGSCDSTNLRPASGFATGRHRSEWSARAGG